MSLRNVDLKNLLSKWKLECILSHLLAEKIDTEILEMMKLSHIRPLLHNFPLGIQIRFEYYLQLWREEIGKPFQMPTSEDRLQLMSKDNDIKTKVTSQQMENKTTQTDLIIYNISSLSNTNNENNKDTTNLVSCAEDQINLELSLDHLSADLSSTPKSPRAIHQVDLLTILKNAVCGIGLITNYGLRQTLLNPERKLLIETIVDHYLKNNIEFNVQTSYAMERAILKMFPSEKLSFYRTNKHGKLYMRYITAKAAEKHGNGIYEIGNSMDYGEISNEEFEELYQFSDDHTMIQTNNTTESVMTDISHIDGENDDDTAMDDSTESLVKIKVFNADTSENGENKNEFKINSGEIDITASLDSAALIRKMLSKKRELIENVDRPFINFSIPWHKVPYDVITSLENGHPLGKRLNALANLIVDDLRKISTHVPMRVLRAVSQQAVMKYPHSFLEKDSDGNVKPSTTTPLLSRLRNRNTFLNRQTS